MSSIALFLGEIFRKFWSGRPGSNRRRPAWEFSIEIAVFYINAHFLIDRTISSSVVFARWKQMYVLGEGVNARGTAAASPLSWPFA